MSRSPYHDPARIADRVSGGDHREVVGGLWESIGQLQFEFAKSRGLLPHMRLLDIGCGCFRGGIHFVAYLQEGNYYGVDLNQSLIDVGYEKEIAARGLSWKLPRSNLICTSDFDFWGFGGIRFDMAVAISLFTHLTFNDLRVCLARLAQHIKPEGTLYATFFECPTEIPVDSIIEHRPGGIRTFGSADPYHYRLDDFYYACKGLPWKIEYVGDWGHPRGQKMLGLVQCGEPCE